MTQSVIKPVAAGRDITQGQNYSLYALEVGRLLEYDDQIDAFQARVRERFEHSDFSLTVNHCSAYWAPGSKPDYSTHLSIRNPDGSNILSYLGGGETPEEALKKVSDYFDNFVVERTVNEPS